MTVELLEERLARVGRSAFAQQHIDRLLIVD
jgi:hypothetical protein